MSRTHLLHLATLSVALGATIVTSAGCSSTPTESSAGEVIDDSVITTKIKAAFVEDQAVSALSISVETFKGTVQLSGFANSAGEVSRAGFLASQVRGVKSVNNDIRLNTG